MTKIFYNAETALKEILRDNLVIMSGGFGLCGIPENLIKAIYDSKITGLTIISNNCGTDEEGLGPLLKNYQIKLFKNTIKQNQLTNQYIKKMN